MSVYNPYSSQYNVQSIFESTQRPAPYGLSSSSIHGSLPPPQSQVKNIAPLHYSNTYTKPPTGPINLQSSHSSSSYGYDMGASYSRPVVQHPAIIDQYHNSSTYAAPALRHQNYVQSPIQVPRTYDNVSTLQQHHPLRSQADYTYDLQHSSFDNRSTLPRQPIYQSTYEQPISYSKQYPSYGSTSALSVYPQSQERQPIDSRVQIPSRSYDDRQTFQTQGNEQHQPQVFGRSGQLEQSIMNMRIGEKSGDSQKRDQGFFFDSYITINGLGTYKKFTLNPRKSNAAASGPAARQDTSTSADRPPAQEQRGNQRAMQSTYGSTDIVSTLIMIGKSESAVENIKNQFVEDNDCNIPSLFDAIDIKKTGNVSTSEFCDALRAFDIHQQQSNCSSIFGKVLHHPSALLSYDEFEQLCLPLLNNQVKKHVTQKRSNDRGISQRTVSLFRRLIEQTIASEQNIDSLRKLINRSEQNQINRFYREMNDSQNNKATIAELENVLLKYQNNFSTEDVTLLFYRICSDKSSYLSYEAFEKFCIGPRRNGGSSIASASAIRGGPSMLVDSSYKDIQLTYSFQEKEYADRNYTKIFDKLRENSRLEVEIERKQQYLHSKRDFKLPYLYSLFRPNNSFVDAYQFSETLKNIFGIPLVEKSDVSLIFRKIKSTNSKQGDLIDFQDFCGLFFSKDYSPPREIFDNTGYNELSQETRSLIISLFKDHLNNEVIFNGVRLEIASRCYSFNEIFERISNKKNYIEKQEYDRFLQLPNTPSQSRGNDLTFKRFDPKGEGITNLTYFAHALNTRL